MVKSFKFLFQFAWVNLAVLLGLAAVVLAGACATGVPNGADGLFGTYFFSFPLMELLFAFVSSCNLCTANLNLGLSFGARRRDFFWALQGVLVFDTAVCWVLQLTLSVIPAAFGWASIDSWTILLSLGRQPLWVFPLLCLTALALGCLCGLVSVRSKLLGALIMIAAFLVGIGATVVLTVSPDFNVGRWGGFSRLLALGAAAAFLVCEALIRWIVNRAVVR